MLSEIRSDDRREELSRFLASSYVGSLATADVNGASVATIWFVFKDGILYFKSRTASHHSLQTTANPSCMIAAYAHSSNYDEKYGVQIKGEARRVLELSEMDLVTKMYESSFAGSSKKLPSLEELCSTNIASTFYKFAISAFKITDETSAGNRTMADYIDF